MGTSIAPIFCSKEVKVMFTLFGRLCLSPESLFIVVMFFGFLGFGITVLAYEIDKLQKRSKS